MAGTSPRIWSFGVIRFVLLGLSVIGCLGWSLPSHAQVTGYFFSEYGVGNSPVYASNQEACDAALDYWVDTDPANAAGYSLPTYPVNTVECYATRIADPSHDFHFTTVTAAPYIYNSGKSLGSGDPCSCGEGKGGKAAAGSSSTKVGDPIDVGTGNDYLQEDDFLGDDWLTLRRFYNSAPIGVVSASIGMSWRHSFDRSLELMDNPLATINLLRPDGRQYTFNKVSGAWTSDADVSDTLTEQDDANGNPTGFTVTIASLHHTELYSASGLLQSVTDPTGQGITLTYSTSSTPSSIAPIAGLLLAVTDSQGRQLSFVYSGIHTTLGGNNFTLNNVAQITLPDGGVLKYTYDTNNNLTSVQYPDGSIRQYVYNESSLTDGTSLLNSMTGIVDETGTRYASTSYNSKGQATSSSFTGGVDATQVAYNGTAGATVTYPLGLSSTMAFTVVQWMIKTSSLSQPCGPQCDRPWKSITYDANGNPQTSVDFNGNTTATTYNSANLLTQEVDAQGATNQRTTTFTWNNTLRLPLTRTVQDANGNAVNNTQWIYNAISQTLARCDIDPTNSAASGYSCSATGTVPAGVRRSTYTYCTAVDTVQCPLVGLLLTATGPRTDVTQTTTYSYYMAASAVNCGTPGAACYQPGDLHTVTDALGHVTTLASYDADGRITRVTDANGVNTDLTYTPRGWLASRSVGGAVTKFTYMPYGAVQTITDPDGVTTTYGYDTAHRLTTITDALGNYIQYTLDAAGDKTGEQVYDSSGAVHKQLTRTFNPLGQLTSVVDGLGKTVFNASASTSYDANGNLVQSSDGLGIQRQLGYDALNRLVQTIDNYNGTN